MPWGLFGPIVNNIYTVWSRLWCIKADPQLRCRGLFGFIRGAYLFSPAIPWDTQQGHCVFVGGGGGGAWGYSNIPRQIGKKVLSAIYVWAPFNPIDAFESCESPLSLEQTISTHLGASRHMEYVSDLPNDKYGSNNDAKQR